MLVKAKAAPPSRPTASDTVSAPSWPGEARRCRPTSASPLTHRPSRPGMTTQSDRMVQARDEFRARTRISTVELVPMSSYISATIGELRGVPAIEPILRLTFGIEAGGLSDGASALFVITGSIHSESGHNLPLGSAAPVLKQLGFRDSEGGGTPYTTEVSAEWTLSDTAIERIEKIRGSGSVTIYPDIQYALISPGAALPDWRQPQRPIRVPYPENPTTLRVGAHEWVHNVLEGWHLAAAVSLVVSLPAGATTDEHRTIISRLATVASPCDRASRSRRPAQCDVNTEPRPAAPHSARRDSAQYARRDAFTPTPE